MSNKYLNYSLSVDKGLIGNIGKMTVSNKWNGDAYMSVMLFLSSNNEDYLEVPEKSFKPQIINVHFPEEIFAEMEKFAVGDLVRIRFTGIDLSRSIDDGKASAVVSVRVKGKSIEMLRCAMDKKKALPVENAPVTEKYNNSLCGDFVM